MVLRLGLVEILQKSITCRNRSFLLHNKRIIYLFCWKFQLLCGNMKVFSIPPEYPKAFLHRKVITWQPSFLCLLCICSHSTFCASIRRETIFLPPSLGGDIHTTDKLCFPTAVKTSYAPYQKLVEESPLEAFILSFPVPSLPQEAKVIHRKYQYEIVNILGTDNRAIFRVKAA